MTKEILQAIFFILQVVADNRELVCDDYDCTILARDILREISAIATTTTNND